MSNISEQIKRLFENIHALNERKYKGDTDAICILLDLERAIELAKLTNRQRQALYYIYVEDMKQVEVGEMLGIAQPNVKIYSNHAINKLVRIYKEVYKFGDSDEILD